MKMESAAKDKKKKVRCMNQVVVGNVQSNATDESRGGTAAQEAKARKLRGDALSIPKRRSRLSVATSGHSPVALFVVDIVRIRTGRLVSKHRHQEMPFRGSRHVIGTRERRTFLHVFLCEGLNVVRPRALATEGCGAHVRR